MAGMGDNGLIVESREKEAILKKHPGTRTWTSIIECISATGTYLPPLVIFKGKSVQWQWFPDRLDLFRGWKFTATENAWTSEATAIEWLEKVFIPLTAPKGPKEKHLLILDSHKSHTTTDFIYPCELHGIHLLFLLPHGSHVLQPLDLTVFSAFKRIYRKEVRFLSWGWRLWRVPGGARHVHYAQITQDFRAARALYAL